MGGPAPKSHDQTAQHDTEAAGGKTATPPAKVLPDGPGLARVKQVLRDDPAADMKVISVLETFPAEKDAIMAYLHKRLGNAVVDQYAKVKVLRTDRIEKGVEDRNISGDWGADPTDKGYLATAKVAEGGGSVADVKTSSPEATALNTLRAAQKRFDPSFVLALQKQLGVADASGAFNTETLRKLLEQPQLASVKTLATPTQGQRAADILLRDDAGWLEALVPADAQKTANATATETSANRAHPDQQKPRAAFKAFDEAVMAWNPATGAADRKEATDVELADGHRADRVAKALGYDSYATYHGTWKGVQFLSGSFNGQVHPTVNERLAVAERWLRQRHAGQTDAQIQKAIGWNGVGNGGYADTAQWIGVNEGGPSVVPGVHMHSFGLAIDIDATHNPYVLGGSGVGRYWNTNMETHLRRAAQLYGGEAFTGQQLDEWSRSMSTEELYAKVEKMNKSWQAYLTEPSKVEVVPELKSRAPTTAERKKGPDQDAYKADMKTRQQGADALRATALAARFTAIGYTSEQATRAASDWLDFTEDTRTTMGAIWPTQGRGQSDKLTTHSQDLMIALRDVAGLMWGGTEMSPVENGDFMHFDLRNTSYGQKVLAANHAQHDATDATLDKKAADEAAAAKAKADKAAAVPEHAH